MQCLRSVVRLTACMMQRRITRSQAAFVGEKITLLSSARPRRYCQPFAVEGKSEFRCCDRKDDWIVASVGTAAEPH